MFECIKLYPPMLYTFLQRYIILLITILLIIQLNVTYLFNITFWVRVILVLDRLFIIWYGFNFNITWMCLWFTSAFLINYFHFIPFLGVEITRLSMPRWVQNGTEDSVVLDCEYNYSEQDDKRLVVKWFLNDDPQPIYQWIPELGLRAASPRLQGRLNMDYAVSPSSQHTRYRALNIMRPTTDLSGRYSCHVVSMLSQDAEDQVMVVYGKMNFFVLFRFPVIL